MNKVNERQRALKPTRTNRTRSASISQGVAGKSLPHDRANGKASKPQKENVPGRATEPSSTPYAKAGQHVSFIVGYYLLIFGLLFWLLLDVWSRQLYALAWFGIDQRLIDLALFRTISFTLIGGALGSLLYSQRLLFRHYIRKSYDPRWFGKYITAPWEGATMAVFVMALLRGGFAFLGASGGVDLSATNNFAAFGVGVLVGVGMRDVVRWVSRISSTMFVGEGGEGKQEEQSKQDGVNTGKASGVAAHAEAA